MKNNKGVVPGGMEGDGAAADMAMLCSGLCCFPVCQCREKSITEV